MSIEEQDAVIGRVARERKEAETRLATLRAEASRLGHLLSSIGSKLISNPETVFFEHQSVSAELALKQTAIKADDIDPTRLVALTDDLRQTSSRLAELKRQAETLGI
jgi:hypothetical protein